MLSEFFALPFINKPIRHSCRPTLFRAHC